MKLEEVIEYFEDISEDLRLRGEKAAGVDWKYAAWCGERAEQNKQIADWLKDYQRLLNEIENIKNEKMLVCPNCGLDVHSDFKNCPRCGERMNNE